MFAGLLLAEVLYLTLTLDSQGLDRLPSSWAAFASWPTQCLRLAITITFVTVALGGRGLWGTWISQYRAEARPLARRAVFLTIHFGATVLFAWISSVFFTGHGEAGRAPALWASSWAMAALVSVLSWGHALLPLARWRRVLTDHRSSVACGAAVGAVAWAFGFVSKSFWEPLATYTYRILGWVLGLIYAHVVNEPSTMTLGTPAFSVQIAPECSGYEGIGLILVFLSLYLFFFRRELRFPLALALLPLGAAGMWVLNLARIIALIAIGDAGWVSVALGGFHSQAGWLAFNAVGLGFVAMTRKGRYFSTLDREPDRQRHPDSTSPYLAPFLVLLVVAMVTGAFSAGFDWLYPARLVILGVVLWTFRKSYASLNWSASWLGLACGVAAFAIWMMLLPEEMNGKTNWPLALQSVGSGWAAAWLAARTVGYVIAVPVAEELAFRGYLTRRFWRSEADASHLGTFAWGAFLLSSAIFGAFHGHLWLAGTLAGMLFALALYRRRSIGDAVLAHATTNGLIAVYVFTTGHWSAWS
jgi:exosortase E/protease (VPEID-CTERM system)